MQPVTRYAKSGEIHIAYQVFGDGPLDLVFVPLFVSNIELYWDQPNWARWLERLGSYARVAIFDKRGTGGSDRVSELPGIELRMDDLRAVMDAAGMEQAALLGVSEGGPLAALFAATYPQRCRALVLYGSFAKFLSWFPGQRRKLAVLCAFSCARSGHAAVVGPVRASWREPVGRHRADEDEPAN
jgi:pimeloyl-ACP methyl ester carboxylesterase